MRKMMEAVLQRYGSCVQVVHGEVSTPVKAFFQPAFNTTVRDKATPLGIASQGQYRYIGPAFQQIDTGDQVIVDGVSYLVVQAESCRDEMGVVYRWAVCRKKGCEDTWASQA